jgi:hypothetical protein
MYKPPFDEVLKQLRNHQGETFPTKTNLEFTYRIDDLAFYPSRTKYRIPISELKKAYNLVPFDGPGKVNSLVRGPAYLWAVLHDSRIRRGEW